MADLIGPFDSADWAQTEWYSFAPAWAPSGIIGTPAASMSVGDFAVTASGLTLTVACLGDRAWIDGSGYKPDTNKTLTVTANGNASLSRRDRLVIRRDLAAQTIDVVRLPGTPASGSPAAPTLTQVTGGIYETPICSFLVPPNNGTTLTGFVDERRWIDPGGRGAPAPTYSAAPLNSAVGFTAANNTLRQITVPDPGYPYRLLVNGMTWALVSPGSVWNLLVRLDDNATGTLIRPVGEARSTSYAPVSVQNGLSDVLTGSHVVLFCAVRISGLAGDGFQVTTEPNVQSYTVQVIPE